MGERKRVGEKERGREERGWKGEGEERRLRQERGERERERESTLTYLLFEADGQINHRHISYRHTEGHSSQFTVKTVKRKYHKLAAHTTLDSQSLRLKLNTSIIIQLHGTVYTYI